MSDLINFVDLFAGAGGLSEGFVQDGYQPIAHVEVDTAACNTLRTRTAFRWLTKIGREDVYADYLASRISRDELYAWVPKRLMGSVINNELRTDTIETICQEIDELLEGRTLDVLVGGVPCQPYSLIGRSRDSKGMEVDARNYLYKHFARFLEKYRPRRFVFENVVGLLSAQDYRGISYYEAILDLFCKLGYHVEDSLINAQDFGVLQNRRRLVLIGDRDSVPFGEYVFPSWKGNAIVNDALMDLPPLLAGEGVVEPCELLSSKSKWLTDARVNTSLPVTWHQARPHNKRDLAIYRLAVREWNDARSRLRYDDLPPHLKTHRNKKSFTDRFKVVAGELPAAHTIVAHICKDGHYYIHPDLDQNRSITPREAARLQSFPDDYYFEGAGLKPSRTSVFRQIGNAVPVLLSRKIAERIRESWNG
ncbi:MAG: DNA cytosine methyltransferase [Gammaproteobacteria bacterium]|nr:DNA cytosine methyltransferase [Gammaproteobacteria bacterium]MDE0252941.1 DNA cytosine methyltransferase [Gammaproteobacteria bacterium]MDE0402046.1 DNA cytosine methyltransferase [Gammaproteobacteria bacterium]